MKKIWKKTEGFTLVELVVVIAVLGILGGVGTVGYGGYVKKANEAADNVILRNIGTAFSGACVSEGESQFNVTGKINVGDDGGLESDSGAVKVAVSGALKSEKNGDIKDSFNSFYQDDAGSKFKTGKNTIVYINNGVALLGVVAGDYIANPHDVNAYLASTLGKMTSSEMLGLVSTSLKETARIWENKFVDTVETASFKEAAASMLGMTVAEYTDYIENQRQGAMNQWFVDHPEANPGDINAQLDAEDAAALAVQDLKANMMMAVSAKQAATAGQDILDVLKKGEAGKAEILGNLADDNNAAKGVSQAALAYGLYTSYVKYNDETQNPNLADFPFALAGNNDGFNDYLKSEQAKTDLAGLMGAMNSIGDQSADTISSAVIGGFSGSDIEKALKEILGK